MDRERVQKPDGKVRRIHNLHIHVRRKHPVYAIEHCLGSISETGHLPVFSARALVTGLPSFEARWDGSIGPDGQDRSDLDIDMIDAERGERTKFKREKDGYAGHHSTKTTTPTSQHRYEVWIETPTSIILDATCTFKVERHVGISLRGESAVTCETEVIRAHN